MIRARSGKTRARRLLIGAGALAALVSATAGCEAGPGAPTLQFHSASSGAHYVLNGITITNVFVLAGPSGTPAAAGSNASLFLALFNNNGTADQFTGATAQGSATSVTLTQGSVALPAEAGANLTGPEPEVVLNNLSKPLSGGQDIPVTLQFAHAGSVTLDVPVEAQSFAFSTFSAPPATPTPAASTPAPATSTPAPATSATPSPSSSAK